MFVDSNRSALVGIVSPGLTNASGTPAEDADSLPERALSVGPRESSGPRIWGNGYLSPVVRFDSSTSTLFFETRGFETGDTEQQYPRKRAVELYQLFQDVRDGGAAPEETSVAERVAPGFRDASPTEPALQAAVAGYAGAAAEENSGQILRLDT
ncbi:MAG: hypothetical protein KJ904_05390 [Alphaproteobacteria bacterium]|nr:hypothetical protein [Alphaproteobacteria bacterium]MBU0797014.1 hypothetical protein [Alphaproteobacteria bacterium]MBU0886579.1 hypothetical protein [Alphaproteobacteria bacterium]MBU1814168.1 hypothetical protein [Alphaproteobacteria bacterium]MBU2089317.1 hypothetical protein [Alphaproteobacteria bacterium]